MDFQDASILALGNGICNTVDYISGKDIGTTWKEYGDEIFYAYALIFDAKGTVPRIVSAYIGEYLFKEDVSIYVFDSYEIAALEGNYYDWDNYFFNP